MEKVIIAGGSGFIGLSLAVHLKQKGIRVIILGRSEISDSKNLEFVKWDGMNVGSWAESLEGALAIVNLSGKSVDCVKTPDNCDEILRSRVESTKVIGKALQTLKNPPKVWVQMSTAHMYGDSVHVTCTESSATGYGLAPFVGKAWEDAFLNSLPEGIREVRLRTSFVIGRNGGALKKLARIAKLGLGGTVGSGKQGLSWIHEFDINEFIYQAIENTNFSGAYIISAPNPVTNAVFMKTLRKTLGIPFGISSPAWLTRLGASVVFKTDPDLALYGRFVKSERLEKEGFVFKFPTIELAMKDLLKK